MTNFITSLIELHKSEGHDLERGIEFEAIAAQSGLSLDEIRVATARYQDMGLAYRVPDMNAPDGVAKRFRARDEFFRRYPDVRKKW
jgi:hypothetical protein